MFKTNLFNKKIILIISIMVLSSLSVFARSNEIELNFRGKRNVYGRSLPNIQLTTEQVSKIQAIENKYYTQIETLRKNIYDQIQIIKLEMSKENPDKNLINKAIDNKSAAAAELQKIRVQCFLEIDEVYKNN
ncbi:hypothetical protein [Brachyspira pulli]|uniref:Spy/CpxP family protein refolding chaperone n=1 Tax=Brachyspira pulli TaxID=310721 RepID=UPI00300420AA